MTAPASRIVRLVRLAAGDVRSAATAALALAAASTGVVIPVLPALSGNDKLSAGAFTTAHVLGGVVGAAFGSRALRRAGSPRRLAAGALIASIAVTLAMAMIGSIEVRVALRFLDGGFHLLAISALVAAATAGDPAQRARRAVIMGGAIVLGVAAGLGVGGAFRLPEASLVMAAALSGAALVTAVTRVAADPWSRPPRPSRDRGPIAPGLLAFCERFSFGSMTIAIPFLAPGPARVGLVLGVFLVASVLALVAAWRFAPVLGARKLAVRSALCFTLALAASAAIDMSGPPTLAVIWAIVAGAASGSLYAAALVLAMPSAELEDRARGMATVHAAGGAGHALGLLSASTLAFALPGMLVVAVPGVAIISAAVLGVWLTVPSAASDCPVIGGLPPTAPSRAPTRPTPN